MRRIHRWRGGGGGDRKKKEKKKEKKKKKKRRGCVGINRPNLKAVILNDHVICLDHELDCFLSALY